MSPKVYGFIPARWGSTRFPGKPLHAIAGKPLIQHVWEQCLKCSELAAAVVATDDERIAEAAHGFGAQVAMTRDDHPSGTDRIAEAADQFSDCTHVINIQGDEPMIDPNLVDQLARTLRESPDMPMITAANVITGDEEINDPNIVKVVLNKQHEALYFSRSVIPHGRSRHSHSIWHRHQGIYGYTREFLLQYVRWEPSPLELTEQLEQLRALENGATIGVIVTDHGAIGVDTPEQADLVSKLISQQQQVFSVSHSS